MAANIPADVFARPAGPYAIGTYDRLWVDRRRAVHQSHGQTEAARAGVSRGRSPGTPRFYIETPAEFGPTHKTIAKTVGTNTLRFCSAGPVSSSAADFLRRG